LFSLIFIILSSSPRLFFCFFFFIDTATTEIYTLSLHDALPISVVIGVAVDRWHSWTFPFYVTALVYASGAIAWLAIDPNRKIARSEEHTSELQSRGHLVCRLLLEKKKKKKIKKYINKNSHIIQC